MVTRLLKEFLDNYDELSVSPIYLNNARGFLNMLLRLMSETTPQFIAENEINVRNTTLQSKQHFLVLASSEAYFGGVAENVPQRAYQTVLQRNSETVVWGDPP